MAFIYDDPDYPSSDSINGTAENDAYYYSNGNDVYSGQKGTDTLYVDFDESQITLKQVGDSYYLTTPNGNLRFNSIQFITYKNGTTLPLTVSDLTGETFIDSSIPNQNDSLNGTALNDAYFYVSGNDVYSGQKGTDTLYVDFDESQITLKQVGDSYYLTTPNGNLRFNSIQFITYKDGTTRSLTVPDLTGETFIDDQFGEINNWSGTTNDDAFFYVKGGGIYDGNSGIDTIYLDYEGKDAEISTSSGKTILLLSSNESIEVRNIERVVFKDSIYLAGNSSLTGNQDSNFIVGTTLSDKLSGNGVPSGGTDYIDGREGNDTVEETLDGNFRVAGTALTATIVGSITVKTGKVTSNSIKINDALRNVEIATINGGASANTLDAQAFSGATYLNAFGGNDLLIGGSGIDHMTGGSGADQFRFAIKSTFGATTADHITDFRSAESDKIQVSKTAFGISASKSTLTATSVSTDLDKALTSSSLFVYDTSNGCLYWNQNGSATGSGTGGVFAVLDPTNGVIPTLAASNIALI